MMRKTGLKGLAVFISMLLSSQAHALSLWQAYSQALESDPTYKAALADFKGSQEDETIARSAILPQVSVSWYEGKSKLDRTVDTLTGPQTSSLDYDIKNLQLQIRQSLINKTAWANARQGELISLQGSSRLLAARDDLAVRLASAYFQVLSSIDTLKLAEAFTKVASERLNQIDQGIKSGTSSQLELAQVQAQLDTKKAEELKYRVQLDDAVRILEDLVGGTVSSIDLLSRDAQPVDLIGQETYSGLQTRALRQNPKVLIAAYDLQIAREELEKAKGAHYPVLDFVASKQDSDSESITTVGQKTEQETLALQLQVPIFSGFGTQARVDKAFAVSNRAMALWESSVKEALFKLRSNYNAFVSTSELAQAYAQSVNSAQLTLEASQKAKAVGLKSLGDVLEAEKDLYSAKRELARVQYERYAAAIQLQAAAGQLRASQVKSISDFIQSGAQSYEFERSPVPKFEYLDPSKGPQPSFDQLLNPVVIQKEKTSDLDVKTLQDGKVQYSLKSSEPSESSQVREDIPASESIASAQVSAAPELVANLPASSSQTNKFGPRR